MSKTWYTKSSKNSSLSTVHHFVYSGLLFQYSSQTCEFLQYMNT